MKILLSGCVILDHYGRMLLLHRNTAKRTQWELPGGKIEPGETAAQAALREIEEELGITVNLVKPMGAGAFEEGEDVFEYTWFQAVVLDADPMLKETELFDDLDYFELEDLPSLALSANMLVLEEKIISGEVVLEV